MDGPRASEGGHWYWPDGRPCYEQPLAKPAKDGRTMTPTTLRHARKFGLYPGHTTIIGTVDKPGLNIWREEQAILAALTLPRQPGETEAQWMGRVKADAKETAIKSAEAGTQIHAEIESSFLGPAKVDDLPPHVAAVHTALANCCGTGLAWTPEVSAATPEGWAARLDLFCDGWIVDFKTHEKAEAGDLAIYDNHHMQLAAQREALAHHPLFGGDQVRSYRCMIVYVHRVTGEVSVFESRKPDLERGMAMFRHLHAYWQLANNYKIGGKT